MRSPSFTLAKRQVGQSARCVRFVKVTTNRIERRKVRAILGTCDTEVSDSRIPVRRNAGAWRIS